MSAGAAGSPPSGRESIAELLARFPVIDPPVSSAGAAVTLVLRDGASDVEVLLIERTKRPSDPASGQVALPGGRVDERDDNLRETAERELEEEVGVSAADLAGPIRFVRIHPAPRFALQVGVFAAELGTHATGPGVHHPEEVAHVFWFPRHRLGTDERARMNTGRGFLDVPVNRFEGHLLWGFTRRVLRDFFGLPPEPDVGGPPFAPTPSEARGMSGSAGPSDGSDGA